MISYRSGGVVLFKNNSDLLIIKEYMGKDNRNYYAKIINSGNKLTIEDGKRPVFFTALFKARIEIYIPVSNKNITIKTSRGSIEDNDEFSASSINMECSSGSISINKITAKTVNLKASSDSIDYKVTENTGDISITSSSSSVSLNIPRNFAFNFSSRISSSSLQTPFSDKLFNPVSDRNSVQGIIYGNNASENQSLRNINIKATSSSIRINWID
jgi:hypothetical protein